MLNPVAPTFALGGEMLVVVGTRLLTVKLCGFDVPPPGVGLNTVILNVPPTVRSLAGIVAVNRVALTKVVVRAEPAKFTTDPDTKLVPLTVMMNCASPTFLLVGEMLVVVGTRLLTVKGCAFEVPPPGVGLTTVTLTVAAVAMSAVRIATVNCVALL